MSPLYKALGLTVGVIVHDLDDEQRRAAYAADLTYGTNNEFGFDYLRDNMKYDLASCVQRGHQFAIVDEVDSILIDEARTPLIISGPSEESTDKYFKIDKIIPKLIKDIDFTLDEKHRTATLTEEGFNKCERLLGITNLSDIANVEQMHHVYQALRAHSLYNLDVDYVVKDGEVIIVDEFTGRQMPGRRWSDGLHQAVRRPKTLGNRHAGSLRAAEARPDLAAQHRAGDHHPDHSVRRRAAGLGDLSLQCQAQSGAKPHLATTR